MHDECAVNSNRALSTLVAHYGKYLGLPKEEIRLLWIGAYLHDLGHLIVPANVLRKKRELSTEETLLIQQHPSMSEYYCRVIPDLKEVLPLLRSHHEKWNGEGYPDRLSGAKIPMLVQQFQICDIYISLTTLRHQRQALSSERACRILIQETQNNWRNPEVVKQFFGFLEYLEKHPIKMPPPAF
jgi:putative two-component system response regulator